MELAFRFIEAAIDAHPRLSRVRGVRGEPKIAMGRSGVTIQIPVTVVSWDKPSEICGEGVNIQAAAANLVRRLEPWWLAWLSGMQP